MPRMSKKRKQEWALFLNDRNEKVKSEENQKKTTIFFRKSSFLFGAAYEARTRYLHLGKVALYQMS